MEFTEVHRFRDAVRELRDAAEFATMADGEARYRATLDGVIALVPRYEARQRAEDRIELGKKVAWLERGRLAASLTQSLRMRYGGTNSVAQFNVALVRKYAIKPVNQTSNGNHLILGNPTASTSTVTGQ